MAGLPKTYIKKYGVSKRAWREYRKAKRKGPTVAKKKTTRRKKRTTTAVSKPKRRTVTMSGIRRKRSTAVAKNILGVTTKTVVQTGIGVAGAIATAVAANMLPGDTRTKAMAQLGIGVAGMAILPRKMRNLRIAMGGASVAGALALVKNTIPNVPLIAGNSSMGLNYYPNMNGRRAVRRISPAPSMGVNLHKGGMAGSGSKQGYGRKFLTQADM